MLELKGSGVDSGESRKALTENDTKDPVDTSLFYYIMEYNKVYILPYILTLNGNHKRIKVFEQFTEALSLEPASTPNFFL